MLRHHVLFSAQFLTEVFLQAILLRLDVIIVLLQELVLGLLVIKQRRFFIKVFVMERELLRLAELAPAAEELNEGVPLDRFGGVGRVNAFHYLVEGFRLLVH